MPEPLVHPALLFEFAIEVRPFAPSAKPTGSRSKSTKKKSASPATASSPSGSDWTLGDDYLLPDFNVLGGKIRSGSVAAAWSELGLYFEAKVAGKKKPVRFVEERGGFSDGLRVWIDTRNSPNVHRAGRFCHCFHFFPGQKAPSTEKDRPRGILDEVARAREQPSPIQASDLQVRSQFNADGYQLNAFIPAACLTGYLPTEFDRIRLFYDLVDFELGTQSQALGPELRYMEDPSLWIETKLVK